MRWGLVLLWWRKPLKELPATFNARAETVAVMPMFRSAFKTRRCVILARGFYEWTGAKGDKTPHYFSAPDGRPLAFAGLWESYSDPMTREVKNSATIIVWRANAWMSGFHDRMPIVLDWRDACAWMAGSDPAVLLHPPPERALQERIVSPRVNGSGVGDADRTLIEQELAAWQFRFASHKRSWNASASRVARPTTTSQPPAPGKVQLKGRRRCNARIEAVVQQAFRYRRERYIETIAHAPP